MDSAAGVSVAPGTRSWARWGPRIELGILCLIWLNVAALIAETVPSLQTLYGSAFLGFERFSVAVFTVEYLVRLWAGGLRFATRPLGVIDLMAVLPFYLPMLGIDLRILRVVRTFRAYRVFQVAKLTRYSTAFQTLGRVVVAKRGELAATIGIMIMCLLVASTIMYHAENRAQPEVFSSIPASMWWAIATLTTVGYGDVYPVTTIGRTVASLVAVLGIGLFALPAGVLGGAFLEEYQKSRPAHSCPHCGR